MKIGVVRGRNKGWKEDGINEGRGDSWIVEQMGGGEDRLGRENEGK